MADTFVKIATVTVGAGGATTMSFSSIPSTYTDLCLYVSSRLTTSGDNTMEMRFNSSTTGYSYKLIQGSGSAVASAGNTFPFNGTSNGGTTTANTFSNQMIYIPNYAGSTNKSYGTDTVTENNATAATAQLWANLWSNTAAITSITILDSGALTFAQYTTATLYGISKS